MGDGIWVRQRSVDNMGKPVLCQCCWYTVLIMLKEWKYRLRSSIHPAIFAAVYSLSSSLSRILNLSPHYHAEVILASPKLTQAIFAGLGDFFTWKLGERVWERRSREAWAVVRSI